MICFDYFLNIPKTYLVGELEWYMSEVCNLHYAKRGAQPCSSASTRDRISGLATHLLNPNPY